MQPAPLRARDERGRAWMRTRAPKQSPRRRCGCLVWSASASSGPSQSQVVFVGQCRSRSQPRSHGLADIRWGLLGYVGFGLHAGVALLIANVAGKALLALAVGHGTRSERASARRASCDFGGTAPHRERRSARGHRARREPAPHGEPAVWANRPTGPPASVSGGRVPSSRRTRLRR